MVARYPLIVNWKETAIGSIAHQSASDALAQQIDAGAKKVSVRPSSGDD